METIPHRELRNNSSAVLSSVRAGRTVGITNHGTLVALLVPPPTTRLAELLAAGRVRPPRAKADIRSLSRVKIDEPVVEVLEDLKGER